MCKINCVVSFLCLFCAVSATDLPRYVFFIVVLLFSNNFLYRIYCRRVPNSLIYNDFNDANVSYSIYRRSLRLSGRMNPTTEILFNHANVCAIGR